MFFFLQVQIYLLSTTYFCKKMQMKIAVPANDDEWSELTEGIRNVNWERISSINKIPPADAYLVFDKSVIATFNHIKKPILLNTVTQTLKELKAPSNVIRINGWKGFLLRKQWDIAGVISEDAMKIFSAMEKQILIVADEPGLVAARPIAMIINEAYFALEQNVSTKNEIDIAMKLGTNYPFGPFEWGSMIGLHNIYSLLYTLSLTDERYLPSTLLKEEAGV
jgi:3-hydroxybutyryl-CoA dehydrogenase